MLEAGGVIRTKRTDHSTPGCAWSAWDDHTRCGIARATAKLDESIVICRRGRKIINEERSGKSGKNEVECEMGR